MIDFTGCQIDILSDYKGSDQKRGIIYNGKRYMLKLSDRISTDKRDGLRDSYSNSVFSEYISCHIIEMCGYDTQKTIMGQVVMDTKRNKDKLVPVVACENFIPEGYKLIEFKNIQNTLSDEKPGRIPKIGELYRIFTEENVYFSREQGRKALERYWDTFIFDALLGNFDRHGNNWGYLISEKTGEIKLAPIYDCGSCLYPQLSDEAIPDILNDEDAIWKRINEFPKAALELENGTKANYLEFINSLTNKDCTDALLRVYPKIDLEKIHKFIDGIEEIADIRKTFYKTMLCKRYDFILTTAYEKALKLAQSKQQPPIEEPQRQYYFMEKAKNLVKELEQQLGRKPTFHVTTFGCQMNARDSEKLVGILEKVGYQVTEDENADFVIFNTCTVRDNANQRVYGRLGVLNGYKRKNPKMKIALCGCMMQEPSVIEKIKESYRFVDLIFGTHNIFKFAELLVATFENKGMIIDIWKDTDKIVEDLPVERKYPFKSGINIMFGCNNFCSYCIVPYVRGRERSRKPKDIIREIEKLAAEGVVEIMLLGQNVNSYGKNLEEPITFAKLLQEIEKIDGIERIRFMTSHPKDLSDELIEVMKHSKKICRHLHLPLQSGSTRILTAMNRRYSKEQYLALAQKIRREIPDIAITTDIIVGFPGETPEDVEETIDVIRKVKYDNAFTFIYSKRTGTPAAAMENQVPEDVVKKGFDKVLKVVQDTAREQVAQYQGRIMEALVEEVNEHDETLLTGRLSNNTLVHFPGDPSLIGQLVKVSLEECHGFYYMGHVVEEQ